jgi:GNAT superfamily N-acetyltransferase
MDDRSEMIDYYHRRAVTGNAALQLDQLTGLDAEALVQPLFIEYGMWVAGRLLADLGLRFEEADLARHHQEFRVEFPKLVGPRGRLLLARIGDDAVGVGALKPVDTAMAEIKRMYVRPPARGQGVGRALLERLLADARAEGYTVARLESLSFMTEAHALYRSLGFAHISMFDGCEAALSGLEGLTYYMELRL